MPVAVVTLFFALLSVLAVVVSVAAIVSRLTGDRFGFWAAIGPLAVHLAAAVATTAMFGSLYLSEVAGYEPCRLCWVQRSFMYPAAAILVAASATGRKGLARVGGGLAVPGLGVALFHRYDQAVGGVGEFCEVANPCAARWVEEFGFVTIPTMAAAGFFAVATLVALDLFGPTFSDSSAARS